MELMREIRERPLLGRIIGGLLIFLILFTIAGFFAVPPILKSVLISKLSERLHRQVTIRQVKVNPFVLSAEIRGFTVKNRANSGTLVSFDDLYINLQTASVWKRGLILKEVRLDRPYLNIIRKEDGTYNFSDLLEKGKPKSGAESKPLRFSLNNIQILNGSLDFLDGPRHTRHKARDVVIKIPFISDLPHYVDIFVQPMFEAKLNDTLVSFKGKTKPFTDSLETTFDVNLKGFNIPYYLAYVPFKMNFKLLSGYVDTAVDISYTQYRKKAPTLSLSGDIAVRQVKIADEKDNRMVNLPLIKVSVSPSDLIARNLHLSRVLVQSPEIDILRDKTGRMNLLSLVPQTAEGKKENSRAMTIEADEMKVAQGRLSFSDSSKPKPFMTTLEDIDLTIAHFSSSSNKPAALELSLQTEAKETLRVAGNFSTNPVASEGTVELEKIPIRKYSPYFGEKVLFDIESAQLDLQTRYIFLKTGETPEIRLLGMSAALDSLRLRKRGEKEDFLRIPIVSIKDTEVDLPKKEVVIGSFSTQKGLLLIKRLSGGRLNIENLLPASPAKKPGEPKVRKGQTEKPWQVMIKDLALEGYALKAQDLVPVHPVVMTVDKIRFAGKNITTAKNIKGKLSASLILNRKGSISANGVVSLDPVSLNVRLNAKALDIVPFQPYFTDKVKIIVTGGALSARGNVSLGYTKKAGPKVKYAGEASVTGFSSLDKANADDFLKWDSLHFGGINAGYNPSQVDIREIALSDFYSRLILNPNGSFNLQGIVKSEVPKKRDAAPDKAPGTVEADKKTAAPKKIKIASVTMQGGTISFSDRHIEPNYSANLTEIGGRISGLSSEEDKFADVDLKGKLNDYAPLEITGKINPLREDLFVDLKADFKDMDLSPMTPYSGRYVGYTIQKGKLALSLKYLIVKNKLDSQNNIFLDQLTLGDKVESPDATKLPVRLAIALLKNRKGEINLDVPVTGYINDPKFSVGRIVLKIIVNLLTKAATSPFALLGAIFGGGEELSYVDFDYGTTVISAGEQQKIDKLIKALYDRPSLKLEIEGHVDVEKDREGLREYLFNKKIRAQKLKDMIRKGLPSVPVDEVKIEKEEYPKYLKMAYKREKFPKPRNILGIAKDLPVGEMEKLMLTHIEVTDDDLRQLASQRALKVKDLILESKKVEPERVFLIQPKSLSPEKKEKLRDSRVDFRLK